MLLNDRRSDNAKPKSLKLGIDHKFCIGTYSLNVKNIAKSALGSDVTKVDLEYKIITFFVTISN